MRAGLQIGFGVALGATALALGGCGGGSGATTDQEQTAGQPISRPPTPPTVVAHRLDSGRIEPGGQSLPARPCLTVGENGTTTIHVYPDVGPCVRVKPGERLLFVNDTGIGGEHAVPVRILVGDYALRLEPRQRGSIPAPVQTYLGRGSHAVRTAGAPGSTVLLLPAVCAGHPPAAPGEELCFR